MRAVSACLLFAIAAAVVSAADACTAPTSDPLSATSTATGCDAVTTCQTALCSCLSSSGTSTFPTCLTATVSSCSASQACYSSYFICLTAVSAQRGNTSNSGCATYGNTLYMNQLAAAASTSAFNTTNLYNSCAYGVCKFLNVSTGVSCGTSSVTSAVCSSSNLVGAATPPAPTPTGTLGTYDVVATLRISGANWTYVLVNATAYAALVVDLKNDLGAWLNISASFIVILNLSTGSLIVNFAVLQGSGASPAAMSSQISSATSGSFLASTSGIYSQYGTDSITTVSATVTQTASPTPAPTTPKPSSALGAAGVWAVATVAAIAALLA